MTNPYQLIVFDWDGTLMDSSAQIVACMQLAAKDCQVPIPSHQAVRHIIGLGLKEAVQALYPNADNRLVQQLFDAFRVHYLSPARPPSILFEGVKAMLDELEQAGYLFAVATGKGRQGLDSVLAETGLTPYFLTTRCADETFSKPHPQMLEDICNFACIDPQQVLMIGDTTYDIEMAQNANIDGLGVSWGVHKAELLLQAGALDILKTQLSELPLWLKKQQEFIS